MPQFVSLNDLRSTVVPRVVPLALLVLFSLGIGGAAASATCPTPSNGKEAKVLGVAMDVYDPNDLTCLQGLMQTYPQHFANVPQMDPNHNGSWNIPPMKWAANALDGGDAVAESRLADYADNQLDAAYGLWGKEPTSWLYWWPLPTMGQVFDNVSNTAVLEPTRKLLQAHVGFLSMFSDGTRVLTPGMRTLPGSGTHDISLGLNYFFRDAVGLSVTKPAGAATNEWGWPYRVTDRLSHSYMSSTIRTRYKTNFQTGAEIDWVVAKLNALNVTTRTRYRIWRYQNGDYATLLEQNTHGTKDPIYAVTKVGGVYHVLGPHRCPGNPQASFDFTARLIRDTCGGSIAAPQNTPLLYEIKIDGTGVTRVQ